jgi:transaldolase
MDSYFHWLIRETPTTWWHDSADPAELTAGLAHGASGVTTNPPLSAQALAAHPEHWREVVGDLPAAGEERAEALIRAMVCSAAARLLPAFEATAGQAGYVCVQVNPAKAHKRDVMLSQARRLHGWAPNISVKLPATLAGLDVLEACASEGITTTFTVSFTVAQVLAAGERFERGRQRAREAGAPEPHCFPVIMIGRLDDYLRDVATDVGLTIDEADLRQAGLAVVKRAYALSRERGYHTTMIVAALRGAYHLTEIAGGELIASVHPSNQARLLASGVPRTVGIDRPVAPEVIGRLEALGEFVKSYEPDGLWPAEFLSFGLTQRTLTQFSESGWKQLETWKG